MIDRPPSVSQTTDDIGIGDELARSGDWRSAIAVWQSAAARDATCRESVERRLTWFLEQTRGSPKPLESRSVRLVIAAAMSGLLGTMLVLAAGEPGSPYSNLLAAVAWVLFIVSATMAVIAARRRQQPELDTMLRRARATADRLDTSHKDCTA